MITHDKRKLVERLDKLGREIRAIRAEVDAPPRLDMSTHELLEMYRQEQCTFTWQEVWDARTDPNWRYMIRVRLLKLAGVI